MGLIDTKLLHHNWCVLNQLFIHRSLPAVGQNLIVRYKFWLDQWKDLFIISNSRGDWKFGLRSENGDNIQVGLDKIFHLYNGIGGTYL